MIYFCRPCREPLDTAECPFCDGEATPFDEIADLAVQSDAPKQGQVPPHSDNKERENG